MSDPISLPFTRGALDRMHTWVHDSLDVLINHLDRMPADVLSKEVEGFGYPTLMHQVLHVLEVESTWMARVHGRPARKWSLRDHPTLTSLVGAKREVVEETRAELAAFGDEALNHDASHASDHGWIGPPRSPAFVLVHVLTHACHHKGQMVAMCRLLGHPAPDTDLQRA